MITKLWTPFDLLRLWAANAVAAGMLIIGWMLVNRGEDLGSQVAWLNLPIAALLVALWSNVRWLLDGRRVIGVDMRRLSGAPIDEPTVTRTSTAPDATGPTVLVAGDGLGRYHRSSCLLAQGKGWETASPAAHHAAGRAPCGVCRP